MFNLFQSTKTKKEPLQGYKITDVERSRKYGVAANSLRMLRAKASEKFKIAECRIYLAQDGVEVTDDDYFRTLPAQVLFVVADKDTIVQTDFELMYNAIKATHTELLNAGELARQFVSNNQPEISKILYDAQRGRDDLIKRSARTEHEEWFEGIDDRAAKTKEEVMKRRGQDRIRGYFYKTKDELTKCSMYRANPLARELIDEMLELFRQLLLGFDYFSCMFDRSCQRRVTLEKPAVDKGATVGDETDAQRIPPKRMKLLVKNSLGANCRIERYNVALCGERGDFRCMGLWNDAWCRYEGHRINPYASRENLILFQVWNLDHQIEISRAVLPSILDNVGRMVALEGDGAVCKLHGRKGKKLSVITYFLELFTLHNLKLVHIVCHDKGVHELISNGAIICDRCEEYKYIKQFQRNVRSNEDALL